jgi:hypothetical protein
LPWDHSAHHVQDWDATVVGYVHRPLAVEETMVKKFTLRQDDVLIFELDVNCFHFTLIRATSSI